MTTASRGRRLLPVAVAVGLVMFLGLGPLDAAGAATTPPPATSSGSTLTWSVRPAPTDDEPSRDRYTLRAQPGREIHDAFRVHVIGPDPITFNVYASDALITRGGAFDLLPAAKPPRDVGAWTTVDQSSVTIPGNGVVDIPFTIRVPRNATPGDHVGGIVTSITTALDNGGNAPVKLDRRLGSRIYLRVDGDVVSKLSVQGLEASYDGSLNPAARGKVTVSYTVKNTGNVRVQADRSAEVQTLLGTQKAPTRPLPELLPGSSLRFEQTITGVAPAGRLKAVVNLRGRPVVAGELQADPMPPVSASTTITAIPWGLLLIVGLIVTALVVWALRRRKRRGSGADAGPDAPAGPEPVPATASR